jgi:hypothetical protein
MESRGCVIAREGGRPTNPGDAVEYWVATVKPGDDT